MTSDEHHEHGRTAPRRRLWAFLLGIATCIVFLLLIGITTAVFYAGNEQIVSTITTGTSPFTIASTTLVTNLNADLLDGIDSSVFQDSPTDWTCRIDSATSSGAGGRVATASCTGSEKVITGGCRHEWNNPIDVFSCYATDQGWVGSSANYNGTTNAVTAYANCCT